MSSTAILSERSLWLLLYFFSNLTLTLYNKLVLVQFPFPYSLTAIHALCGAVGGIVLAERGIYEPKRIEPKQNIVLLFFGLLYALNIAVSNVSLGLVTVPVHQVIRAATPIFVMAICKVISHARYSRWRVLSLLPVITGVAFATFGDYYCTSWGLILTLLGAFLAAVKTVLTSILQSSQVGCLDSKSGKDRLNTSSRRAQHQAVAVRLHLHPLDLLSRLSPLAFILCVAFSHVSGELDRVRLYSAHQMSLRTALVLLTNGLLAFALNVVSFSANRKVGPLSMTVAANVKQVLTILIAVFLFNLSISPLNAIGILLTLLGGAFYAHVDYNERNRQKAASVCE